MMLKFCTAKRAIQQYNTYLLSINLADVSAMFFFWLWNHQRDLIRLWNKHHHSFLSVPLFSLILFPCFVFCLFVCFFICSAHSSRSLRWSRLMLLSSANPPGCGVLKWEPMTKGFVLGMRQCGLERLWPLVRLCWAWTWSGEQPSL